MSFKEWIKLAERTLYHGTVNDNIDSIMKFGLLGGTGSFVQNAYGDYSDDLPDLSFAADKEGIDKAVTAMVHHIGQKLNKDFHDVNDNDIRNHGVLFIIKDGDDFTFQRPYKDTPYDNHPMTVEPGDYYSEDIPVTNYLTGSALLRHLRNLGAWPRTWGENTPKTKNLIKGDLIRRAIPHHPEIDKSTIMQKIQGLKPNELSRHLDNYR